jgi:hypothetical protein
VSLLDGGVQIRFVGPPFLLVSSLLSQTIYPLRRSRLNIDPDHLDYLKTKFATVLMSEASTSS